MTTTKLNSTGLRWVGELSDFYVNIKYRPGKSNTDADSLSQLPRYFEKYMASCNQMVTQEEIGAMKATICCAQTSGDATWLSSFTIDQNSLYEDEVFLSHNPTCCQIKTVDLAQAQDRYQNIKHIKDIIGSQKIPTLTERRRFLYELPKLQIDPKSNILYHRSQVVLPQELRRRVYKELHEDMGHLGTESFSPCKRSVLLAIYAKRY